MSNESKKFLRIIDANYNRAKEGLRVTEDIFRFVEENDNLRKKTRFIRHRLTGLIPAVLIDNAVKTRDSAKDIGRKVDRLEAGRNGIGDILRANLQRAKESLRVLEECLKVALPKNSAAVKSLRYKLYDLEKDIVARDNQC